MKKPIICINNRTQYPSIREAALDIEGYESALSNAITKVRRYRGSYWIPRNPDLTFAEQVDNFTPPESRHKKKRLKNLTTGVIFPSICDAAASSGVSVPALSVAIKRGSGCGGSRWEVLSEELYQIIK